MSWISDLIRNLRGKTQPAFVNPQPNLQPVHPSLIGNFVNGFLVYCGLISAGLVALVASDRFGDLSDQAQWVTFGAIVSAFIGGGLALVGFCFAINYARAAERRATPDELARERIWALGFTNAGIWVAMIATAAAGTALAFYLAIPRQAQPQPTPPPQTIIIKPVECKPQIIEVCGLIDK